MDPEASASLCGALLSPCVAVEFSGFRAAVTRGCGMAVQLIAPATPVLEQASVDHQLQLGLSFTSKAEVQRWGGEQFRWPLTRQHFLATLQVKDATSYAFMANQTFVGFGQLCDRFARHHLARLWIHAEHRGQGLGRQLLLALLKEGMQQNPRLDFSLFVFKDNLVALSLYQTLGFRETTQPQAHRDDLMFMTLANSQARQLLQTDLNRP